MKLGFLDAGSDVDGMIQAIENLLVCKCCPTFYLNRSSCLPRFQTYVSQVGQVPIWHKFLMGNPLLPILLPSMEGWDKVLSFTPKAINTATGRDTGSAEKVKQGDELDLRSLERRGDMLSKWYALKLSEPDKISTRDLVVHLSTNVFAGSDTTATALRAVFYYLSKVRSRCRNWYSRSRAHL